MAQSRQFATWKLSIRKGGDAKDTAIRLVGRLEFAGQHLPPSVRNSGLPGAVKIRAARNTAPPERA
jgi:hypothetical protein